MNNDNEYTGVSGGLKKPTKWLASEDLPVGKFIQVEIERVEKHTDAEFDKGRKETVGALRFKGREKAMVLNATNRRLLVKLFGNNCADWKGKTVEIYVATGVKQVGGGTGLGLRLREFAKGTP